MNEIIIYPNNSAHMTTKKHPTGKFIRMPAMSDINVVKAHTDKATYIIHAKGPVTLDGDFTAQDFLQEFSRLRSELTKLKQRVDDLTRAR